MKIEISDECADEILISQLRQLRDMPTDNLTHEEDIVVWKEIRHHAGELLELIEPGRW